jgi:N-acyl-D-amino-acid deacylase
MKLVTFHGHDGVRHGVLQGEPHAGSVVELGSGDLLSLIEAGPAGLARARAASGPRHDVADVRLLAPLLRPPKLLTLARNYQDHGEGAPARRADIGISGERIAAIGDLSAVSAERRIDASGRVVCPGFVDAHSHSDLSLLSDGRGLSKVHQGVTTEIVGNCGLGVAPLADRAAIDGVRSAIYLVDPDPAVTRSWRSMGEYLARVEDSGISINVAALAGHLGIHASVLGYANRLPTTDEVQRMRRLLDEALDQGAIGLSTGLMYAPISYAQHDELVALGDVVARYDRPFATHMRNCADALVDAVDEVLHVGAQSGCRVQASHLAVVGRRNWGKTAVALEHMDRARSEGVRVRADSYPYLAGSANLSQLLPIWAHEGGTAAMVERLRSTADRERIVRDWQDSLVARWEDVLICWVRPAGDASVVGKRVSEIAAERHVDPSATALDLIAAEEGLINMIAFGRSDADLERVLKHPDTLIGSDGLAVDPHGPSGSGHPHPRYYGCYPRLLGRYVREQAVLSLETAVHRASGLVAQTFGLADRGQLSVGSAADVVVFDPETIVDEATFLDPQRFPTGIDTVIVNGTLVIDRGVHTAARPGRVLRGA